MQCSRRAFLTTASGVAVGSRLAAASAQGANDRVRIGIIGTGGRARGLMNHLKTIAGAEMVALCDVFEPRLLQAAEIAPAARKLDDYRRILDDGGIDAVLIGAPDHWHRRMTLDAVAAGKDVYVEKPVSHTIEEGAEMVKAIEASKQIVQTGTQQRSWDHFVKGREIVQSGRLGQITFVHAYWYQHMRAGQWPPAQPADLDWQRWLGPAPDQPFRPERFYQWRHYWDFGGGCLTDLLTHWIDVVHWYMNVEAPLSAYSSGKNYNLRTWEAPDTVTATLEYPNDFTCAYLGTYVSRVDDGGLEFRGDLGTLKINRAGLALYKDDAPYVKGTLTPAPELVIPSTADGSIAHLQNWIDCVRSRRTPNAPIRAGHHAARAGQLANASLRAGARVRWNAAQERVES
jgi:predicted dehydrogenase